MFKTLVYRWHNKFQDYFIYLKDGSRPVLPKLIVANVNVAAMAGLIKGDIRLRVNYFAHSVGISSWSAHKILTHQLKF